MMWFILFTSCPVQSVLYDVRIFLCMDGYYILSDSVMAVLFRQVPVAVCLSICLHVYSLSVIQPKHVLKHVFKNLVIGSRWVWVPMLSTIAFILKSEWATCKSFWEEDFWPWWKSTTFSDHMAIKPENSSVLSRDNPHMILSLHSTFYCLNVLPGLA